MRFQRVGGLKGCKIDPLRCRGLTPPQHPLGTPQKLSRTETFASINFDKIRES